MPPRLICESEESKEDEGTRDERPTIKLKHEMRFVVALPRDARDLRDLGIILVDVGPAHPRKKPKLAVDGENPRRCGDGPKYLDQGQTHQADVATLVEATVRRHNLAKLTTAFGEIVDGHNCS